MQVPHTDLILESGSLWQRRWGDPGELPGIKTEERELLGFFHTRVEVLNEEGARQVGKPPGIYETLSLEGVEDRPEGFARGAEAVARCIAPLLPSPDRGEVLVVGLGNRAVTADAVGPRCAGLVLATRHLAHRQAEQFSHLRPVAAVAPGVLGTTGVESGELVEALCRRLKPQAVIAVDALAARSVRRLCTTVQIANTGITPGSGVGNARRALDRTTLGVPVIAMGVPTVVSAGVLARELGGDGCGDEGETLEEMLVTPKDVDAAVGRLARIMGFGINLALQPGLTLGDIELLLG